MSSSDVQIAPFAVVEKMKMKEVQCQVILLGQMVGSS